MRVLITGATGFVGAHMVRRLLREGSEVAALIRPSSNPWRIRDELPRLNVVLGEFSTLHLAAPEVMRFAPEAVIHLAWFGVLGSYRNDVRQVRNNVDATINTVSLAARAGASMWMGFGSQAEYGSLDAAVSEDAPTQPTTLYGVAKLGAGLAARCVCRDLGVRYAWLRLFSAYGPMDDPAWFIPHLTLGLLRGESPPLTVGTQMWDYLYVDDVVEAAYRTLTSSKTSGVYNLGSGRPVSIRAVAEQVRDLVSPSTRLRFGEVPLRPDQVVHMEADIARLTAATGWAPEVSLAEGLSRTIAWFRGQA